jgi:hypothetical protein
VYVLFTCCELITYTAAQQLMLLEENCHFRVKWNEFERLLNEAYIKYSKTLSNCGMFTFFGPQDD